MRVWLLAAAVVAILLGADANLAQSQTNAEQCDWRTARSMSVIGIERSGERFKGQCVRTYGQLTSRNVGAEGPGGEYVFIGAYFDDELLRDTFDVRPRTVRVLGVLGHCSDTCRDIEAQNAQEAVRAAAEGRQPDEILCMPIGHCHYYNDPYIQVQAVH